MYVNYYFVMFTYKSKKERGIYMSAIKKIKSDMCMNSVITILIGILFLLKPHGSLKVVAIIAGILILISGLLDIIFCVKSWLDPYFTRTTLFTGILKTILGIFIFTHSNITTILFSYVFSIFIVINGIFCLEASIYAKTTFACHSSIYILISAIIVLAGICMLFITPDTVTVAAIMGGVIFLFNGIVNLILLFWLNKIEHICTDEINEVIDDIEGNIIDEEDIN